MAERALQTRLLVQSIDSIESAEAAGCRYVDDGGPGIRRIRCGRSFRYVDSQGKPIKDERTLQRIRGLVIPPAWERVWICPSANGHIQATGRDARARKQYRYHPRFREIRDETKYERMLDFANALPDIRAAVDVDLQRVKLERDKVLATVVRLLEITLIRVGNEEYARQNGSFGLTTLRNKHVDIRGSSIRFRFRGKSRIEHTVDVQDRRLARILQRCTDLPGEELFQYVDEDDQLHPVESVDVNDYLRRVSGAAFTAKDYRTWAGTVLTAHALGSLEPFESEADAKRNLVRAVRSVAERLGNTPAVCRKCYVHPFVIESYLDGRLAGTMKPCPEEELLSNAPRLSACEAAVRRMLTAQTSKARAA